MRVALLWGGVLAVFVLATSESPRPRPAAPPAAAVPTAPASAFLARRGHSGLATGPIAAQRAIREQATPPSAGGADEVEVCGVGKVRPSPSDPGGTSTLEAHRSNVALAAWLDSVIQGGDERARAAALLVRAKVSSEQATRDLVRPEGACRDNEACRKPFEDLASSTGERAASPWRDRLVQLAARTADPAVFAYAVQACGAWQGPGRSGSCQQVSLEQWARIDERNAVPWLYVAQAARVRGDAAAAAEAMNRAAQADHWKLHGLSLVRALVPEEPRGLSRSQAALLVHDLVGLQSAVAMPYYALFNTQCGDAALAHPSQRDTCTRLAELMLRQGDTLTDLTVAARVGERLGWPKERVAATRAQAALLSQAVTGRPMERDASSCESVDRLRRHWINVSRVGERAAILENVAASGLSIEEVARRNRLQFETLRRPTQDAALRQ